MKIYKVKRNLATYIVEAPTRNKAKYAAYKEYRRKCRRPKAFFPWVVNVSRVVVLEK